MQSDDIQTRDRDDPIQPWTGYGMTPKSIWRVWGLQRAGNHAVISWLQRNNEEKNSVFLNCCAPYRDPFQSFNRIEINGRRRRRAGSALRSISPVTDYCKKAGKNPTLIMSYENAFPNLARRGSLFSTGIPTEAFNAEILVHRSFLNWIASYILLRRRRENRRNLTPFRTEQELLSAMVMYGRYLDLMKENTLDRLVTIDFDQWVASEGYREGKLQALNLEPLDNSLGETAKYGGGSSFGGEGTSPNEVKGAQRWLELRDDMDFRYFVQIAKRNERFMVDLGLFYPQDVETISEF